jgi:hypothetical protein
VNLTEQQQRALEHARQVLAEMPSAAADATFWAQWYAEARRTLAELVDAFGGDQDGGAP